ncbi:GMC family oxidoreductase N-terminal domain-containing protein, partial [Lactococcus lactis]|uniref:GMC family oxidoreductase N-terminal domain-containing protein n=1 Tax=Lactococcus lactis TaxID=1358 RepID=UPI003D0EFB0A
GTMRWAGTDTVLGPLIEPGTDTAARFELRDLTLVRRIEHDGARVRGVWVEDLRTREEAFVAADAVVVAADAFRSPQLLWASGIRPAPLGRYLTEHHVVIGTVVLDGERMSELVSDD